MNDQHPIAPFVTSFFQRFLLAERGLSPNTVLAYRDGIKLLLRFAAEHLHRAIETLTLEVLDDALILAFLDHLQSQRDCSTKTRNDRLTAIRSFFSLVAREEPALLVHCQKIRDIQSKRTDHVPITYLEEDEMKALLASVDLSKKTGLRDTAILLLLYNTGARASEISSITMDALLLHPSGHVTLLGKGRKSRICPLWPETVHAIEAYTRQRQDNALRDEHLFLNAHGRPIGRFGIRYVVQKYVSLAARTQPHIKSKRVSPHTLRHSTAMHLLRAGNDLNTISYWLGHADPATTHHYVEIDMNMKRKMLDSFPPPRVNHCPRWHQPDILRWLDDLSKSPRLCEDPPL